MKCDIFPHFRAGVNQTEELDLLDFCFAGLPKATVQTTDQGLQLQTSELEEPEEKLVCRDCSPEPHWRRKTRDGE